MRFLALLALLLLPACAHRPAGALGYMVPETIQFGLTAPNLVNGPIATTRAGQSRRDAFGQIGLTAAATWRIIPIRIERAEVQPVRVVPEGSPQPALKNHGY